MANVRAAVAGRSFFSRSYDDVSRRPPPLIDDWSSSLRDDLASSIGGVHVNCVLIYSLDRLKISAFITRAAELLKGVVRRLPAYAMLARWR